MKEEKKFSDQYKDDAYPCTELQKDRLDEVSGGVDRISGKKSGSQQSKETKEKDKIIIL